MSREFKCRKCEYTDVSIRWLEGKNEGMWSKDDRLRVCCKRCSYCWEEKTSDKVVK